METKIKEIVSGVDKEIQVTINENDWSNSSGETWVTLSKETWGDDICVNVPHDEPETIATFLSELLSCVFIKNKGAARENYAEVLIDVSGSLDWGGELGYVELDETTGCGQIQYEIGQASKQLASVAKINHVYDEIDVEELTSIKIYNINTVTGVACDQPEFSTVLMNVVKSIMFELSHYYQVDLKFIELPIGEDELFYDPYSDVSEKLTEVERPILRNHYDKDLIDYFYRALQMNEDEFKYLAYYQVLECIFDEVLNHELIQDIKQILTSNWFRVYKDENIQGIIDVVDQYSKNRNDRDKLKLVLDKYFKGTVHDEAFYTSNKALSELLKRMGILNQDKDLKDMQKLASVIYDYRCKCTHSNRAYSSRVTWAIGSDNVIDYISLIKMVAERVIINYSLVDTAISPSC